MGAYTTSIGRGMIHLTPGATHDADWDCMAVGFPQGMKLGSIKFYGSAANDILIVRDGAAAGPIICKMKDATPSGIADAFNGTVTRPYIKASDQTFGTPANVVIILEYL